MNEVQVHIYNHLISLRFSSKGYTAESLYPFIPYDSNTIQIALDELIKLGLVRVAGSALRGSIDGDVYMPTYAPISDPRDIVKKRLSLS